MIFIDTCILIDHSKGKINFTEDEKKNFCINSIAQLEFLTGAFNKKDFRFFDIELR